MEEPNLPDKSGKGLHRMAIIFYNRLVVVIKGAIIGGLGAGGSFILFWTIMAIVMGINNVLTDWSLYWSIFGAIGGGIFGAIFGKIDRRIGFIIALPVLMQIALFCLYVVVIVALLIFGYD